MFAMVGICLARLLKWLCKLEVGFVWLSCSMKIDTKVLMKEAGKQTMETAVAFSVKSDHDNEDLKAG